MPLRLRHQQNDANHESPSPTIGSRATAATASAPSLASPASRSSGEQPSSWRTGNRAATSNPIGTRPSSSGSISSPKNASPNNSRLSRQGRPSHDPRPPPRPRHPTPPPSPRRPKNPLPALLRHPPQEARALPLRQNSPKRTRRPRGALALLQRELRVERNHTNR
jgi:hypothetical protein